MIEPSGQSYEKQARDAVAARAASANPTPAEAALTACEMLSRVSRSAPDPREAVVAACKGAVSGAFIANLDVVETSVLILKTLATVSISGRVDPEKLMTWVMEGIAEALSTADAETRSAIQQRIDGEYMGAGAVFSDLCDKAIKRAARP